MVNFLNKQQQKQIVLKKTIHLNQNGELRKGEFFQNRLQFVTCLLKGLCWELVGFGWMECHLCLTQEFVGGSLPVKVQIRIRHGRFFQCALMFYGFVRVQF